MSTNPTVWNMFREWFLLLAAISSASFAGMIWWLARKRLTTSYILRADSVTSGVLALELLIVNRSDQLLSIEELSVKPPLSVLVGDNGQALTPNASSPPFMSSRCIPYRWDIQPSEKTVGRHLGLLREGGFADCKKVSIRLHILSSFPVIRQRKKVLTAILPASIRMAKS